MVRGLMAGGTDYSGQSFEDIKADLLVWRRAVQEVARTVQDLWHELEDTKEWQHVSADLKSVFARILKFLDTAYGEIDEVLDDFEEEVRTDHVARLRRLAKQAWKLNVEVGRLWNSMDNYDTLPDDEEHHWQVETIYRESRDMVADMLDIGNAAARLEDFVGRRPRKTLRLTPNKWGMGIDLRRAWRKLRTLWRGDQ